LATSIGGNCSGTITDAGFNISDDGSCEFTGTGSRNGTNLQLNPSGLANNGGPTPTIAVLPSSPAIDVIPPASFTDQAIPPNQLTTDQRGLPRPDPGEAVCDAGALEFQDPPPPPQPQPPAPQPQPPAPPKPLPTSVLMVPPPQRQLRPQQARDLR
jgi:hypothetical protein